jgi:beta-galactosidase
MKENGFNAIRASHNPPSKVFLDACDELGILVIDESFDQWQRPKNPEDYNLYFDDWWGKDIESMVLRDRNHPSVIIWSIGNEINERADSSGLEIARNLKEKILSMDNSRPVTQAICHFWDHPGRVWDDTAPAFAQMDVHSYNYRWTDYEPDHEKHPYRIMIGTESFPMEAFENWELVEKNPYVIGDFVWTGMDYFGESGIGHTGLDNDQFSFLPGGTWFNAYCGDISILGNKKPQMFFRDVVWRHSELEMLVHAPVPAGRKEVVSFWGWPEEWKSWNWEGNEGNPLLVTVYSRCDQVRLELNGKVIGSKEITKRITDKARNQSFSLSREIESLVAKFEVPYEPGELVAVGIRDGKEVVRQSLKTTGQEAAIKITPEQETVKSNGSDLAYFTVEVVDNNGILVPSAVVSIDFEIHGKGILQAVANGNPNDMKSFKEPKVNSFRGRCQVIVRSGKETGEIRLIAKSYGLIPGEATVGVRE